MAIYIPSVDEAAKRIIRYYADDSIDELNAVSDYLENNDVAKSIAGNGDEFHNATVKLAKCGFYDFAYALAKVGYARYPRNTDLLGDLICYGLHCKSLDELQQWYIKLDKINRRFWTWRAYQFSFDYWMERLPYAESDTELHDWEKIIEGLFSSFKQNFQYLSDKSDCEKAYMMEFEYYNSKGDEAKALAALEEATKNAQTANKCAQCALKLADRYFETGNYEKSYFYSSVAVNVKEDQASISLGYAYYILAMSLEWKERKNRSIAANIKQVYSSYYSAYMHLEADRVNLLDSVKKQVKQLEFEYGQPSGISFDDLDKEKSGNIAGLLGGLNNLLHTTLLEE